MLFVKFVVVNQQELEPIVDVDVVVVVLHND
jgi:hypothetical protein